MADLLIRDLDEGTKQLLREQAVRHGRTQQGEAKAILESSLRPESSSWVTRLRNAAQAVGGIDLEDPHVIRLAKLTRGDGHELRR